MLGKALGTGVAAKSAGVMTSKAFAGKLGSPFISKAIAAGSGALAGTFAGTYPLLVVCCFWVFLGGGGLVLF